MYCFSLSGYLIIYLALVGIKLMKPVCYESGCGFVESFIVDFMCFKQCFR